MDQLEIIGSNGAVEFYNLNPTKGLTNIGQHPENDVVLTDPHIAPFQAMLDHRQKPYQLLILSDESEVRLRGYPLPLHQPSPLQNLDNIELGSYTIILVEGQGIPLSPGVVPPSPTTALPYRPASPPLPAPPRPTPRPSPRQMAARPQDRPHVSPPPSRPARPLFHPRPPARSQPPLRLISPSRR